MEIDFLLALPTKNFATVKARKTDGTCTCTCVGHARPAQTCQNYNSNDVLHIIKQIRHAN